MITHGTMDKCPKACNAGGIKAAASAAAEAMSEAEAAATVEVE